MRNSELLLEMSSKQQDFTSIRILLQVSIQKRDSGYRQYISKIVRDAKLILDSFDNLSRIDREMFDYSIYLGARGSDWITGLNPDNLKDEDIRKMLEVFEMP